MAKPVVAEGKPQLKEPAKYAVLIHNDDYTTMEFVVEVLRKYFSKTVEEATQVMLHVHKRGKGVAGVYSHDIAETKSFQVETAAVEQGFPLKCSIEKV